MPITAIRTVSKSRNGVSSFILPCKRMDFHYCDWAGSSRGMNAFLKSHLPAFATANRSIEISISPRPSVHPIIRASYVNGREKVICVRNLAKEQILKKAELLRDASGDQLKRRAKLGIVSHVGRGLGRPGEGVGEKGGVRGIWSPFHLPPTSSSKPFKI